MKTLDAKEILRALPHREPMLLIDRVVDIEEGQRGTGIKNVTISESFFRGHFPGDPVMPGVLVVECMAQTAAAVFAARPSEGAAEGPGHTPKYLVHIRDMKFRRRVVPGDQLVIDVKLTRRFGRLVQVLAEARVGTEIAAVGRLTFGG